MNCPKCGGALPNDSVFCSYCGCNIEEVRAANEDKEKRCSNCRNAVPEDSDFCPYCGRNLSASELEVECIIPTNEQAAPLFTKPSVNAVIHATNGNPTPDEESIVVVPPIIKEEQCKKDAQKEVGIDAQPEQKRIYSPLDPPDKKTQRRASASIVLIVLILIALIAGIVVWLMGKKPNTPAEKEIIAPEDAAESVLYLEILDKDGNAIGSASGFLLNDEHTLVTNYHVVYDAYSIVATSADGKKSAEIKNLVAYDETADLAILSVASDLSVLPLTPASSDTVKKGDTVYAVGYPLGIANTLSDGIVSSRYIDEYGTDIIQVTAAISEGNSGGPLLNEDGHVIGVMCAYYTYGQNLNIAVSSNTVTELLKSKRQPINMEYWVNRPLMPGYEPNEENEEVPIIPEATPPEPPKETTPETPSQQQKPQQQPPSTPLPEEKTPENKKSDSELMAQLQGMWVRTSQDQYGRHCDFYEFSGNSFMTQHITEGYSFFLRYRGTFDVKDGNIYMTLETIEDYSTNLTDVKTSINEWAPRTIVEITNTTLVFGVDEYNSYQRTYQYPETPLDAWGRREFSKEEIDNGVRGLFKEDGAAIPPQDVSTALSQWLKNNGYINGNGYHEYSESIENGSLCLSDASDEFLLIRTETMEDSTFSTVVGVPKSGGKVHVFLSIDWPYGEDFSGLAQINASSFSENMALSFDQAAGDAVDLPLIENVAKYSSLDSLCFLEYVLTQHVGAVFDISDFGFVRNNIIQ